MNNREITKIEQDIANDILLRSNYNQEEANKLAKDIVDFGYIVHEQEYLKLKKVIEFIKENFEIELHYDEEYDEYTICFMEYDECLEEIAITGVTKYVTKEEYELLKEMFGNER